MQMLNPGKTVVKDADWIKQQCVEVARQIIAETSSRVVGFVMDSAAANRAAFEKMDAAGDLTPLINLPCASHTLSLLLKDLDKKVEWIQSTFEFAISVSTHINQSTILSGLFDGWRKQQGLNPVVIPSHSPTRFGSKMIVLEEVNKVFLDLMGFCTSKQFRDEAQRNSMLNEFDVLIRINYGDPNGFFEVVDKVLTLCRPIMEAMTAVEADKAYLSRTLPMIKSILGVESSFSAQFPDFSTCVYKGGAISLNSIFQRRLKEFYYRPSMAAAYLVDPINFVVSSIKKTIDLPFDSMEVQELDDALNEIARIGGSQAANTELNVMRVHGLSIDHNALEIIADCASWSKNNPGEPTIPSLAVRQNIWKRILAAHFPEAAKVAVQLLSMHTSSCAAERNLSTWGRLYDKYRGHLHISRAEKMVFVSFNDSIKKGEMLYGEEQTLFAELADPSERAESDAIPVPEQQRVDDDEVDDLELYGCPVNSFHQSYFH